MNKVTQFGLALGASVLLCGCSSINGKELAREIVGKGLGNASGSEVGYNAQQCYVVKNQCVQGEYQEWRTSDGVPGCSCKKL